jgi:aminopeptidase N
MPSLTRVEAARRADLLHVEAYAIELDLTEPSDRAGLGSVTTIRFSCRGPGVDAFMELECVELRDATLNGKRLDVGALVDNRLTLTRLAADNELVVRATMAYSNTGEGCTGSSTPRMARSTATPRPFWTTRSGSSPASTNPTSRRR